MFAIMGDQIEELSGPNVETFFDTNNFYFYQDRCAYKLMEDHNVSFYDVIFFRYSDVGMINYSKVSFPQALKKYLNMAGHIRDLFNELINMKFRQYQAKVLNDENQIDITAKSQIDMQMQTDD